MGLINNKILFFFLVFNSHFSCFSQLMTTVNDKTLADSLSNSVHDIHKSDSTFVSDVEKSHFPGGEDKLLAFLANNIKLPVGTMDSIFNSKFIVQFQV